MNLTFQILNICFFSVLCIQTTLGQISPNEHSFRITGETKLPDTFDPFVDCMVEYDTSSFDHLIITAYKNDGNLISKISCRFTGKNFKLKDKDKYLLNKTLIPDGIAQIFTDNNILEAEMIYDNNNIVEATTYYRTGNKHIFLTKSNNVLNGSYKIWFENGKLNLEGNYENNEKDGHFQLFDEFGTLVREGNYERGKLVSGEAVVADLLYENPNTKASFSSGPEAFSDVLKKRSAELEEVKKLDATYSKYLNLKLKIGKKGIVSNVDFISNASDNDIQIIKKVFYGLTDFIPGKEEGVSVNSILYIEVQLSNGGLNLVYDENDTIDNSEYFIVEEMPEYPGGETALRQFIATKIKYPVLAQENGIQGKVYVSFVIDKDGLPGSFTILQSVHPLLDEEAINVLKSMPRWKPGFQKGKPVRVLYTVPVGFVLQ